MENKKYILNFEEYSKTNEEFLGKLAKKVWDSIKNSASKAYSKTFGSYSKIEALFKDFESKIMANFTEINEFRNNYIELLKQKLAGNSEVNESTIKNIRTQIANADKKLENIKNNLYKQLDLKANSIIKDEKNPKVKELIQLKKLELEQRLDMMQYEAIKDKLTDDFVKAFPKIEEELDLPTEAENTQVMDEIEAITVSLNGGGNTNNETSFNLEEAKKNDKYIWKNSPYLKDTKDLKEGTEILYFSKSDFEKATNKNEYFGTVAYISSDERQKRTEFVDGAGNTQQKTKEQIEITQDKDNLDEGFVIHRGKIIKLNGKDENPPQTNQSSTANVNYSYAGN